MSEKIIIKENKTLKLVNVLIRDIPQAEIMNMDKMLCLMQSYILTKNNTVQGPLIQYSDIKIKDEQEPELVVKYMLQLTSLIEEEFPYQYKSMIKQENCLFARFNEKEENLEYAYQKLSVYAFENDIKLRGNSYTVFVNRDDEKLTADIFMPIKK